MNKNKDLLDSFTQHYCHWCQAAVNVNMLCGPLDPLKRLNIDNRTVYYCENCRNKYEIIDNNLRRIYPQDFTAIQIKKLKKIINGK